MKATARGMKKRLQNRGWQDFRAGHVNDSRAKYRREKRLDYRLRRLLKLAPQCH